MQWCLVVISIANIVLNGIYLNIYSHCAVKVYVPLVLRLANGTVSL